ncbi:hypothetical protein [Brenneria rubrifaciens]|uniref:Autotransporter outer membrane beta-barrel domain-containing protein n=1 Tax=Brenneria rubrifaciens TaxID=55213 RepID=A0A4V1F9W2_9GAMM|nr:hypothetical protein [Brenneria rubrifaciens]QCR08963.1 hypothetical protein EH207_10720 [Brenneria rubrifaciens]
MARKLLIFSMLVLLSAPAVAAENNDDDDDDMRSSYAKLLDLSSVDDVSSSKLRVDDGFNYSKIAIPYTTDYYPLATDSSVAWFIKAGFLEVKGDAIPVDESLFTPRWRAFSIVSGPSFKYRIQERFNLVGKLGVGYSRLIDNSLYSGDNEIHNALKEAKLLDWEIDAYTVSPSIGIEYKNILNSGNVFDLMTNLSFTHVSSFNNHNNGLKISDNSGSYSIKTDYTFTDLFHTFNRRINFVVSNKFGGFNGSDYRDLGFGFVNETQMAIEIPTDPFLKGNKIRMGIGYLFNDYAQGVSLVFSL